MDEFALIRRYFQRAIASPDVVLGNGDDCAVVRVPAGKELVVSMDTVVEGRHFLPGSPAAGIASRALCTALSDLAAMGAEARWFTLALTLPEFNEPWLAQFSQGLFDVADSAGCVLIGGDTTRGPLTVTVQVHGLVNIGCALTRAGAQPGDGIYVTGTLGDGAAALANVMGEQEFDAPATEYLQGRFYRPEPQLTLGQTITPLASAAIDISDGLLADLGHICKASAVGAEIMLENLPIHSGWAGQVSEAAARQWALSGGDDYQLCFTVAPHNERTLQQQQLPVTKIGVVTSGDTVSVLNHGTAINTTATGFNHFG